MDTFEQHYQEALDFIYSFVDFSMKRHVDDKHRFFKLDRMRQLTQVLGNPEAEIPFVHVAGTKGKGSTASFIARVLQAAGYKVGLYTSPHLVEFTERIQINSEQISKADVVTLAEEFRGIVGQVPEVTTFELMTAMAFCYFKREKVDIAVLEVGLGGRLDATNVITPLVSVITSISFDHVAVLGNTLKEIAWEKGGIIKPGRPVVISAQKAEALAELLRVAEERGSPAIEVDQDYVATLVSHDLATQAVEFEYTGQTLEDSLAKPPLTTELSLLGEHQAQNAATALAALDQLQAMGWKISREDVQDGFSHVKWPTRFEILRKEPPIILDSAHNGDSMYRLRQTLQTYFPHEPFILVLGASADKQLDDILDAILPGADQVITTQSLHPRAMDASELAEKVKQHGIKALPFNRAEDALTAALEMAGESTGIIVTGSMFIAAAAGEILRDMGIPENPMGA